MTVPEVRALLRHLLKVRRWDEDEILWWSQWRQTRNQRAADSHRKRRMAKPEIVSKIARNADQTK